jgi:class 3 adenylate cyclase/tetratricopeptide (TPR) repeat protein
MQCRQCQQDNVAGSNFCRSCGTRLIVVCASCGTELPSDSRFCHRCGTPVGGHEGAAAHPFASPASYTPQHIAERIVTSKSALEGERKQVTVLFCDIVESTRLAERLDPEAMHTLMDGAFRLMAEAVHRYEGTVNQFLGDGLMALFGAPLALEDHAVRAVRAALAIQETLSGYATVLRTEHDVGLRLRFGLNTGPVVVGRIGDDLRMDYTAIGDTTHVAARLQAMAEPGTILISEATQRQVEGYVRSEPMGPMQLRHRSEPVSVFRVTGRRPARSRLEVAAERGLTQLVGREAELRVLHDRLARVRAGESQLVTVTGEPGAGKSRLLYEFHRGLASERLTWREGHCETSAQSMPYLPIVQILQTEFDIEDGDNPLQVQDKLRQGVVALDPALEPALPFLRELFGLAGGDEATRHLEPQIKRLRTFEAILAVITACSRRRPLVVMVEDLHWIDRTSEDCLAFLVDHLGALPVLLLTTHRPGYVVRWTEQSSHVRIALDLLTERESESMATALIGAPEIPPELLRVIWDKAEGNPLFVEEIATALRERGVVGRGTDVRWPGGAVVDIPPTIQDIIRARIDRLGEPVKRTVQNAAVIGREFGLRLLQRISDAAPDVEPSVDTLKRLEFIHETRFAPELEFIFKHAVIKDVTYESLLVQRRRELHGAVGRAIEELYADRLEEQAALLAYHYARSDHGDRAVAYALTAGHRAARLYANTEARAFYEEALAIACRQPASAATDGAQIDAILGLAAVGVTRQDIERDLANLEQARTLAERTNDEPRMARVLYWRGRSLYVSGDSAGALEWATRSLAIADRLGDDALAAPPVNLMGRIHALRAEFARAAQLLERSVEQMRRLDNKSEESTAAGLAGWVLGWTGEFSRALVYADDGIRLAREIRNPFAEAAALLYRGIIADARGTWRDAIADFAAARTVAERAGDRFRAYLAQFCEGRAHTMAGDPARGRALLEESLARAEQIGTKFFLAGLKTALAQCLVALGELPPVPGLCREAIQVAQETGDRFFGALAHRALAEALGALPSPDLAAAERELREAIRILEEIGARPERARTALTEARLLARLGRTAEAAAERERAVLMFETMGMTWDLSRARD